MLVGGSALAPAPLAHADVPPPRAAAEVTVAGSEEELNAFLEALTEPLDGLGLRIRGGRAGVADAPPAGDARTATGNGDVLLWIDARRPDTVELLVEVTLGAEVRRARRSIVRDRGATSLAVTAEDVAYEARSTLEALLATVPSPPVPPPPPVVHAPPVLIAVARPAPAPLLAPLGSLEGFGVDVALLANARALGGSTAAYGVTGVVDLAPWGRRPLRPSLWISGTFDAPVDTPTPLVALTSHFYAVRVLPSLELARVGSLRLAAGAGFGLDFFRSDAAESDTSPITLRAASTYVDPILEAGFALRARLFDRVGLLLAVALDDDLAPHHFSATDQSGVSNPVLTPWTVRPVGMLGVCVSLTGPSGCAGPP